MYIPLYQYVFYFYYHAVNTQSILLSILLTKTYKGKIEMQIPYIKNKIQFLAYILYTEVVRYMCLRT